MAPLSTGHDSAEETLRWQGQKEEQKIREAVIAGAAADWFGRMADDEIAKALDLCGFPFDANGVEKVATREELEKILPRYLDTQAGSVGSGLNPVG